MENLEKLYQKALHFLSFRPRSEKEVRDYLKKKKADDLTLQKIIDSLRLSKFIDDREFTKWWVEQRTKIKPKAIRIIKFELRQKGIEKELVEEVLDDKSLEIETEFEKALKLAQAKLPRFKNENRPKKYEKMVRFLSSKGFDYDLIKEVIDRIFPR